MKERQVKNTVILFNEYIYKEIDLDSFNKEEILISNINECDIKINITMDKWSINLVKEFNNWVIKNPQGVYYVINNINVRRFLWKKRESLI